ncbi:MAG TPA: hypothetical protein VFL08_05965 [Arthrobacter sp.]|nr:hypothetical protein [Arthrobacter sp.]
MAGPTAGGVVIDPIGLAAGGRVVVPDRQPAGGSGRLADAEEDRHDPLTAVLIGTRGCSQKRPTTACPTCRRPKAPALTPPGDG